MKYVLAFVASEFVNFRQAEFSALVQLQGLKFDEVITDSSPDYWLRPYLMVNLDSDAQAKALVERSVLIKSIYHCWCDAPSFPRLLSEIATIPTQVTDQYLSRSCTYKVVISSANKKISHETKLKMIEDVLNSHPKLDATVCLSNPQHHLHILLDYAPKNWPKLPPDASKDHLRHLYYGRLVATSKRCELINSYRLSNRNYLGNTSMDVRLSGIMANVGLCRPGTLVWDPFLGTGSIVLVASIWGAYGAGSDIDYALLHGMGMSPKAGQGKRLDDECLRNSYAQYGLEKRFMDVVVADVTTLHRLLRSPGVDCVVPIHETSCRDPVGLFDAILTDPPYGFRERSCRVAEKAIEREPSLVTPDRLVEITGQSTPNPVGQGEDISENQSTLIPVPHDLPHFPHKEAYPLSETYRDLINLADRFLRPGGRLVFWIPVKREMNFGLNRLPTHPRLRLLCACEQILNGRNSRYMVAMEKLKPTESDECETRDARVISPADPVVP